MALRLTHHNINPVMTKNPSSPYTSADAKCITFLHQNE